MKVFLTGGSGYVGRSTVTALVRHGHEVSALARSDAAARVLTELGATPVAGGLTDAAVLRAAAAEADGVIHLGQHYGPDTAEVDRAAADALQDGLGDRGPYVHTGGVWVYGDTDGVVDEDAPQRPPAITAWRRANEERVLAHGGHPVLVMPGLVYGLGGGLIDTFFVAPAREEGAVPLIGDGANHWALVHVEDVAELYALALRAPAKSVYAGVSGQNLPLADIVEALTHAAGCPGRVTRLSLAEASARMGPIAEAFALDQRLTSARAQGELGWRPRHLDALAELRG
ncbi:NAD-dependent epimerase/dehydratase family protein [Amycolatopsis nalaikhensis]|uniref:NAD-dependent epimerase/dehydratase family protein n=1 Tax=Amycolatopsis nalaikhensis TaxID=715472 RepID=A0ABY8XHI5_9PSEU|nr:NAD-dependent epimerase/dehydratase family protein [Amycolatopsis sp. 2-2]WIV55048.1 NAD-dependent epimerase/dehydratase family protein [Amycolatopsis sp. 2-2]